MKKTDCFHGALIFQFHVICVICTFVGHIFYLYTIQRKKEQEIERLEIENLQSRCDALTNQINPHFFFNSLNSLAALIRKKNDVNTLAYINTLSDVFRYILQSEKKGLVSLEEELQFVQAFRYMLEVRYTGKLIFNIDISKEQMDAKIPVLSLLPLIDNIIVHNTIDSEHKMEISILLNDKMELIVTNSIFPKLTIPDTNGTGIKNLENRFILLLNKQIRIENDGNRFAVFLPLK
jgi:LytS/YehU family sensor histidine kinase